MIRLLAPAKLNLCLRVMGKRSDGYHEIETLFERIDLVDELTVASLDRDIVLTCDDPQLDCGPDNLIIRAARLLQETYRVTRGAAIHLAKRIPIAAGLGGGSSDAAATLIGLTRLWNIVCSTQQLHELAAQLGSDVPCFLCEAPFAIGRGRGELLEPLSPPWPTLWHVLVVPPVRLATKDIYAGFDASWHESNLTARASSRTMLLHALRNGSPGELAKGCGNELAPEAIRRCPVIADVHALLQDSGCLGALVSGSGPAVFGLCSDEQQARVVAARLAKHQQTGGVVRVVSTYQTVSDCRSDDARDVARPVSTAH